MRRLLLCFWWDVLPRLIGAFFAFLIVLVTFALCVVMASLMIGLLIAFVIALVHLGLALLGR